MPKMNLYYSSRYMFECECVCADLYLDGTLRCATKSRATLFIKIWKQNNKMTTRRETIIIHVDCRLRILCTSNVKRKSHFMHANMWRKGEIAITVNCLHLHMHYAHIKMCKNIELFEGKNNGCRERLLQKSSPRSSNTHTHAHVCVCVCKSYLSVSL